MHFHGASRQESIGLRRGRGSNEDVKGKKCNGQESERRKEEVMGRHSLNGACVPGLFHVTGCAAGSPGT